MCEVPCFGAVAVRKGNWTPPIFQILIDAQSIGSKKYITFALCDSGVGEPSVLTEDKKALVEASLLMIILYYILSKTF